VCESGSTLKGQREDLTKSKSPRNEPLDIGDLVSSNLPQISRGQPPIRKAKVAGAPRMWDGQLETCQPRYFVTQLKGLRSIFSTPANF
jgi:hypothetical protein